jgi:hypothetical protein
MKIKGWEKISGLTYKGYALVNPIHNADETKYEATVLDLNQSHKPKWELSILTPRHKWKHKDDLTFNIWLCDENKVSSRVVVTKEQIQTISGFRMLYEDLIEKILHLRLQNTISTVTKRINGGTSGISNIVNNNGTSIDYNKMMIQLVNSIKEINQNNKL